jgi:hypothetical protein
MTPEERARAIKVPQGDQYGVYEMSLESDHVPIIASAIREAVEEEREACAKVADSFDVDPWRKESVPEGIAAAIRARNS